MSFNKRKKLNSNVFPIFHSSNLNANVQYKKDHHFPPTLKECMHSGKANFIQEPAWEKRQANGEMRVVKTQVKILVFWNQWGQQGQISSRVMFLEVRIQKQ